MLMNDDAEINAEIRDRSRRFVMIMFTAFSLLFSSLALAAHWTPAVFSMELEDMPRIAASFLFLASAYTLTMFVWDLIFPFDDE
jgi:hypothetical protein